MGYYISAIDSFNLLFGPASPVLIDVRRLGIIEQSGFIFPQTSIFADQCDGERLAAILDPAREILIACAHAHNRSQLLSSDLARAGFKTSIIEHGADGWVAAGLPRVLRKSQGLSIEIALDGIPKTWITRRLPKIDRVACPWLIQRFLDPGAKFVFAEPEWVLEIASQTGAIAYDIPGAALEHEGPLCTFDTLLRAFGLDADPALAELATLIRGADTNRLDLHPASAGLLAISLGLSARHGDKDHSVLKDGFIIYDGLYSWLRSAKTEIHNWPRPAQNSGVAS